MKATVHQTQHINDNDLNFLKKFNKFQLAANVSHHRIYQLKEAMGDTQFMLNYKIQNFEELNDLLNCYLDKSVVDSHDLMLLETNIIQQSPYKAQHTSERTTHRTNYPSVQSQILTDDKNNNMSNVFYRSPRNTCQTGQDDKLRVLSPTQNTTEYRTPINVANSYYLPENDPIVHHAPISARTERHTTMQQSPMLITQSSHNLNNKVSQNQQFTNQNYVQTINTSRTEDIKINPLVVTSIPYVDYTNCGNRKPWPGLAVLEKKYLEKNIGQSQLNPQQTNVFSHNKLIDRANNLITKINTDILQSDNNDRAKQYRSTQLLTTSQNLIHNQKVRNSRLSAIGTQANQKTVENTTNEHLGIYYPNKILGKTQTQDFVNRVASHIGGLKSSNSVNVDNDGIKKEVQSSVNLDNYFQRNASHSNFKAQTIREFDQQKNDGIRACTSQPHIPRSENRTSRRDPKNSAYSPIIQEKDVENFLSKPLYSNRNGFSGKLAQSERVVSARLQKDSYVLQSQILSDQDIEKAEYAYFDDAYHHAESFKRNTYNRGPSQDILATDKRRVKFGNDLKGGRVYYALPKTFYGDNGYKCDYEGYTSPERSTDVKVFSPRYKGTNLETAIESVESTMMI